MVEQERETTKEDQRAKDLRKQYLSEGFTRMILLSAGTSTLLLVLTVLFALFDIHLLPDGAQLPSLIVFLICSVLVLANNLYVKYQKKSELWYISSILTLAVFSIGCLLFALFAADITGSVCCLCIAMLVVATVPLLSPKSFAVFYILMMILAFLTAGTQKYPPECLMFLISLGGLTLITPILRFRHYSSTKTYRVEVSNVRSQAQTDPMTGLLNRRGLDEHIENVWPYCIRKRYSVAVLMLDIDNFKKFNDHFGHLAGDECIKAVANVLDLSIKDSRDVAARVGGEEFLIMLTAMENKEVLAYARGLSKAIEMLQIPQAPGNFKPVVSVSIGVAFASTSQELNFEYLKDEADKSLYDAKYNGRDCVFFKGKRYGEKPNPFSVR